MSVVSSVLEVNVKKVDHLPRTDRLGKCDPFVALNFGGHVQQTSVKKNVFNADFDESFQFEADRHGMWMMVELYDWNRTSNNEKIGNYIIAAEHIDKILSSPVNSEHPVVCFCERDGKPLIGNDGSKTEIHLVLRVFGSAKSGRGSLSDQEPIRRRAGVMINWLEVPAGSATYQLSVSVGDSKEKFVKVTAPGPAYKIPCEFNCSFEFVDEGELSIVVKKTSTLTGSKVAQMAAPLSQGDDPLARAEELVLQGDGFRVGLHLAVAASSQVTQELRVLACSWNVGNAKPPRNLSSWFKGPRGAHSGSLSNGASGHAAAQPSNDLLPDIIFVGVQESSYEVPGGNWESDFVGTLREAIASAFPAGIYCPIVHHPLGQIRALVWARMWIRAGLGNAIETGQEATGVGHVMANKGGVAVGCEYWGNHITFVNAHLAAHQGQLHRRNEDYLEIVKGIRFGGWDILTYSDHIVWVGDLNYRLGPADDAKSPTPEAFDDIVSKIERRQFKGLLETDQLRDAYKSGHAFFGFVEGEMDFKPTFKVERKEGFNYVKSRLPAYCDRVLWQSTRGLKGKITRMWAAEDVASSDHKPVAANLRLFMKSPRPWWWPRTSQSGSQTPGGIVQQRSLLSTLSIAPKKKTAKDAALKRPLPVNWKIEFLQIEGFDLLAADVSGTSDPYIIFSGTALVSQQQGKHLERTLNPVWDQSMLPSLSLAANRSEDLRHESIMLKIMDRDMVSADDEIGVAVVPLSSLIFPPNFDPFEGKWPPGSSPARVQALFSVPVLHQGKQQGQLRGRISMGPELYPQPIESIWQGRYLSIGPDGEGMAAGRKSMSN